MQFHILQAKMERKWKPAVLRALKQQIRAFIAFGEANGYEQALAMIDGIVEYAPITDAILGIYKDIGVRWGYITYRDLNQQKRANDTQVQLLQYMEQYFREFILDKITFQITEDTRDWIRETMIQGLADGKSYFEIARTLEPANLNNVRALRIVRTETVRAANAGAVEGAKKTGLVMNKIWISAKDNRTRRLPRDSADHLHLDTQKVGMDGSFEVQTKKHGVVKMLQPGDPSAPPECTINCRCTVGMEAIRDQRGRLIRTP